MQDCQQSFPIALYRLLSTILYLAFCILASLSEQLYLNSFTLAPLRNPKSLILWGDE
ncbi:hypothetical protein [Shewanella sp. 125m-1]